jgi:hypothetical protein
MAHVTGVSTVYRHGSGIRNRQTSPLNGVLSPSGPSEVPARRGNTMITLRGMALGDLINTGGVARVQDTGEIPFDPAEFTQNQNPNIPEQANPPAATPDNSSPTGTVIRFPSQGWAGPCPAWGCSGPQPPTYYSPSVNVPGTTINTTYPYPGQAPPPAPVNPAPPATLVPAAVTSAASTVQPVGATPATPSTPALVPVSSTVTNASALTALQLAAGAVGFNASGQPVDVNGNVIGVFSEISAWMSEQSLVSGVPNYIFAIGGAALVWWMMAGKRR